MSMTIRLNGNTETVEANLTVLGLLTRLGIDPQRRGLALAMNGALVPRRTWSEATIAAGADVEIVQPLQGG